MTFLIPVIVYSKTGSLGYSGLAYGLWWLPRVLMIPLVGTFIDKLGIKPVSVSSDIFKIIACIVVVILSFNTLHPLVFTIACGVLGGIISIGNSQTIISYEKMISLISINVEKDANLITRLDLFAMMLGPIIGMFCYDIGYPSLIIIAASAYLINALFFLFNAKIPKEKKHIDKVKITLLSASKEITSRPLLILMIAIAIGNNMFDGTIEASGSAIIATFMSLPVKYFGLIDVSAGLFGFLVTYLYMMLLRRLNSYAIFLIGWIIAISSSLLITLFMSNIYAFLVLYAISISTKVFMGNHMRVTRIKLIPTHSLASVSSLIVLSNQSILPAVGMMIYILNKYEIDIRYLIMTSVTILVIAGMCLIRQSRK